MKIGDYDEINGYKVADLPNNPHKMIEDDDFESPYSRCVVNDGHLISLPNTPIMEPKDYFKEKLESDRAFIKVWDTMVNDPDEVKKLKELFGTEFEHINNHFLKIKNTK